MPLLVKLDIQTIFAPAVVLSLKAGNVHKNKLIAGVAFEVNAQTEIHVTSSTNQLRLISLLAQETLSMAQVLLNTQHLRRRPGEERASCTVPDSGIDCSKDPSPAPPPAAADSSQGAEGSLGHRVCSLTLFLVCSFLFDIFLPDSWLTRDLSCCFYRLIFVKPV